MHFVSCKVRLAGDMRMEVFRGPFNPVSYPEVEVLRFIHGDDAVLDVKVIAEAPQTTREEKERLSLKYGVTVLETVFPGKNPQMDLEMPKAQVPANPVWRNPLDKEIAGYDVDPTVEVKAPQTKPKSAKEANPFAE